MTVLETTKEQMIESTQILKYTQVLRSKVSKETVISVFLDLIQ